MGFMSTIRDALALPALAARGGDLSSVPVESPWASPNHLIGIDPRVTVRSPLTASSR